MEEERESTFELVTVTNELVELDTKEELSDETERSAVEVSLKETEGDELRSELPV